MDTNEEKDSSKYIKIGSRLTRNYKWWSCHNLGKSTSEGYKASGKVHNHNQQNGTRIQWYAPTVAHTCNPATLEAKWCGFKTCRG